MHAIASHIHLCGLIILLCWHNLVKIAVNGLMLSLSCQCPGLGRGRTSVALLRFTFGTCGLNEHCINWSIQQGLLTLVIGVLIGHLLRPACKEPVRPLALNKILEHFHSFGVSVSGLLDKRIDLKVSNQHQKLINFFGGHQGVFYM